LIRELQTFVPLGLYRKDRPVIFRYLCRKALALQVFGRPSGDRFIEVGFGLGDWMLTLADFGLTGVGVDLSPEAVSKMREVVRASKRNLEILCGDIMEVEIHEQFDWVFAFEVLEHLEDDEVGIRRLANLSKPNGKILLSVPAHMRYWTRHDEAAGHFRRYERADLIQKLSRNGFRVELAWCYGFPLSNLLGHFRSFAAPELRSLNMREKTIISGVRRPTYERLGRFLSCVVALALPVQLWLQNRFLLSDIGDGYVVAATKTSSK